MRGLTYTLRVDLLAAVVEDVAVALAADGALVESHDVLRERGKWEMSSKQSFSNGVF